MPTVIYFLGHNSPPQYNLSDTRFSYIKLSDIKFSDTINHSSYQSQFLSITVLINPSVFLVRYKIIPWERRPTKHSSETASVELLLSAPVEADLGRGGE